MWVIHYKEADHCCGNVKGFMIIENEYTVWKSKGRYHMYILQA